MTDDKLRRARALLDLGLTVREAATRLKVGKTALCLALAPVVTTPGPVSRGAAGVGRGH
jgi:hypothetical protein